MGGSVVLVISPHPDDDVVGCGGTLSRAASQGCDVRVLYVTDGSASHIRSKRFPPATVARIREREAANALRAIGITRPPLYLRAPDGALAALPKLETTRLVTTIASAVRDIRPAVVFSPWCRDPHVDHAATARLVARALRLVASPPPVLMYAVWLGILGTDGYLPEERRIAAVQMNLSVDEVALKRKAILEHVSQTTRLIDDDPDGFLIGPELLARWLLPYERFYYARGRRARSVS